MSRLSGTGSKSFSSAKNEQTNQASELYHLKVLIPTTVVGSIIGRGGSIVTSLENTYHVKIALSCINDIYPGSNDRVCLISGDMIENILAVNDYIMTEVNTMPDTGRNMCFDYDRKIYLKRSKQVKFLIPQISAAKIIGHRGKTIKWMKANSGSFIQISQSSQKVRLYERCIIVAGDLKSNKKACRMIFNVVAEDTKTTFYKNFSYSNINYPIPSAFPTGPALAGRKINDKVETFKVIGESCNVSGYVSNKTEPPKFAEFLDTVQMILEENAYKDSTIEKAKKAFHFLIRHDILNVCSPVIGNFWNFDLFVGHSADDNAPAAALGNASVPSNVRPTMGGNESVFFNDRSTMCGNASVSFNDMPTMGTGNASVYPNVRPVISGNASVSFNDRSTTGGNTFIPFNDRPAVNGNGSMSFSDKPAMGGNASMSFNDTPTMGNGNPSMSFNDTPTMGNANASMSFNDTPAMGTGNASAPFSGIPTMGIYPSDTTNQWGNLMKPTVSENLASSFFSSGRNQNATPHHYMPLWNHFSSPMVSINNCAHINMPNCCPGSSELPHEDLHYPMVAARNPGTNVVPDVGMKFI